MMALVCDELRMIHSWTGTGGETRMTSIRRALVRGGGVEKVQGGGGALTPLFYSRDTVVSSENGYLSRIYVVT